MSVQSNRLWVIGAVMAMIALAAAGWFLGIQPLFGAAAAANEQRINLEAQNQTAQQLITKLAADQKNSAKLTTQYEALAESIPASPRSSKFIDGLDALAAEAGVTISGIMVGASQAYTAPLSAGQVTTGDAAPSSTPAPIPPSGPAPPPVITNPLITAANFVAIQVSVDVKGPYSNALKFVHGVQYGDRLMLVTGFRSTTDDTDPNAVTAKVSGYIYVLRQEG
jgi:hypothetical protein